MTNFKALKTWDKLNTIECIAFTGLRFYRFVTSHFFTQKPKTL